MNGESLTIIIGGDFVPTNSNKTLFQNNDINGLIGNRCKELLDSSDFTVINLETPLTDNLSPIMKWGPNLGASVESVSMIKKLGVDVACIANNHIMDQGVKGLESTMNALDKYNIQYVGAGMSQKDSSKVVSRHIKGKTISIYAFCENEFSTLNTDGIGANPLDVFVTFHQIKAAKENCDILIVLFHGGIEEYRYPTPRMRKIAQNAIDNGADVFICQHSHCIGTYEQYKEKNIIYGQGNFIFDEENNEFWNSGMLLKFTIGEKINVDFIPIIKNRCGIRLAENNDCRLILESFHKRSNEIKTPGYIEKRLEEYSRERIYKLLKMFGGKLTGNILYRGLDKVTHNALTKKIYNKKYIACILDYMRCESLNDVIISGCTEMINSNGDQL